MMLLRPPPPPPFLLLLFAFFWVCLVHVAQAQTQLTTDPNEGIYIYMLLYASNYMWKFFVFVYKFS